MGKFSKADDPTAEDPAKKAEQDAQMDELIKLASEMKRANETIKLNIETVTLDRVAMGKDEMADARKRFVPFFRTFRTRVDR